MSWSLAHLTMPHHYDLHTFQLHRTTAAIVPVSRSCLSRLKKGHKLALKAFDSNASAYKENDIVRTSMDHYLRCLK